MNRLDCTLYLVTDRGLCRGRNVAHTVAEAMRGGITVVQLREKLLEDEEFLRSAVEMKELADRWNIPLIINDRLDIALACGAAGVHLGQDDTNCALARRVAGERMIVGVSVSTVEEALKAEADGADYLGVSPVFSTPTKPDAPAPAGLEGLRKIRGAVRLPLVGIGGINTANAADVIDAGADGVAVVSAIMAAQDPCRAARELRVEVERGRRARTICSDTLQPVK